MNVRTFGKQAEEPLEPAENTGTIAHSRRVAAWCEEFGRALRFPPHERAALCSAALSHHRPELLGGSALGRLITDLGLGTGLADVRADSTDSGAPLTEEILSVFQFGTPGHPDDRAGQLGRILEAANCLDEQLEFAPFEAEQTENLLAQPMEDAGRTDEMIGFVLSSLRMSSRDELAEILPKLPVYPAVAMRLYRLLKCDDVNLSTLESIARADQVVAGKLVRAANSAYFSPRTPIRTVAQAISYVGTEDSRRILLASSVKPLYSSPRMRKLWKHATEAAQVAERIADLAGSVDPAEAFLLGLLHDVGKLAISLLSRDINDAVERLLLKGCQPATAETVLCGFDHAEAGGEVLRHWKFTEELITAVQYHHQPERSDSRLASILYLTEFWTDSEEDLPSNSRLNKALQRTGLTPDSLELALSNLKGMVATL